MKRITAVFAAVLAMGLFKAAIAAELTAEEIVKRAEDIMRGQSNIGKLTMIVTNPNFERTITMEYWEKGQDLSLVKITSPAKEAGTVFLKVENNMWNYIHSAEMIIDIPPSMMMNSWMGSDFTNDDLVRESSIVDDYMPFLLENSVLSEGEAYTLELTAKPDAPVVWGKILVYVRVSDYAPLKYEYYDEKGKLMRIMTMSKIVKMGKRAYPTVWTMEPKNKKNHKTIVIVDEIKFDVPISDKIFSYSNLKRGIIPSQ
ncbi:MAG: outer membrane lipoprotein-sorting protein [Deltaproteobacteria bacterium]|uniref:Outer membrane lipoprotein-sorting protein n=1 Tax=Candidatus Zymogenus saltonus TaxID=2844893 RepID=A0A9D8PPE9_9DELT|nr:outer membrane lipoprotein-sorting protein [Candidatus Zymogenus saltonus]